MSNDNHLQNLLRILAINESDGDVVDYLSVYASTRGLLKLEDPDKISPWRMNEMESALSAAPRLALSADGSLYDYEISNVE